MHIKKQQFFIGHSFSPNDHEVIDRIKSFFSSFGLMVDTGERPEAKSVSEKIKERIIGADVFVGVFTRKHKISETNDYTTSPWVLEEKTFALGIRKPILILVEEGVDFSGGLQGDYEYVLFKRDKLSDALIKSIPYVLSIIDHDEIAASNERSEQIIDEFEADRIAFYMVNKYGISTKLEPKEQNRLFRESLLRGELDELDYQYEALEYVVKHLNDEGFDIARISKSLFKKYSRICRDRIEQTKIALYSGTQQNLKYTV